FVLELDLRCDFAALFEVKRRQIIQRGKQQTQWDHKAQQLRTTYDHDDFHRGLVYHITAGDSPAGYANGRIFFELELEQNTPWHVCADLLLEHGQQVKQPQPGTCSFAHQTNTASSHTDATHASQHTLSSGFDERQQRWRDRCTAISTTNNGLLRMYQQAIKDMGSLRIYDMDVSEEAWVAAAGVPWFVTLFGRDSLTVSYQNMTVSAGFARGALKR